jgi:hypothetical protein
LTKSARMVDPHYANNTTMQMVILNINIIE